MAHIQTIELSSNLTASNKDIRWIWHKYRGAFGKFSARNAIKCKENEIQGMQRSRLETLWRIAFLILINTSRNINHCWVSYNFYYSQFNGILFNS